MASVKKFVLVRWIEEEQIGVMPITAAVNLESVFVGSTTQMKWKGKKLYDVEVLKVSCDQRELHKDCDKLVNFELSTEDFISEHEQEVSSTIAHQSPPILKKKGNKKQPKSVVKREAAITEAMLKAGKLFDQSSPQSSSNSISTSPVLPVPKKPKREVSITTVESDCDSDECDDGDNPHISERERALLHQVSELKKKLANKSTTTHVTKNVVSNSTFETLSKNITSSGHKPSSDSKKLYSLEASSDDIYTTLTKPKTLSLEMSSHEDDKTSTEHEIVKVCPSKVELVPGYGVFISKRLLHEAEDSARSNPTRLIRNLIGIFFTKEVLASSSAYGGRQNVALDQDILGACLRYVQSKYTVSRSLLIDSINDKCANARRKNK